MDIVPLALAFAVGVIAGFFGAVSLGHLLKRSEQRQIMSDIEDLTQRLQSARDPTAEEQSAKQPSIISVTPHTDIWGNRMH